MPIDIASGIVTIDGDDVEIPGKVALTWRRHYSTARLDTSGALGPGWRSEYDATLTYRDGAYEFTTPKGAFESFPDNIGAVANGETVRHLGAFIEIFRQGNLCIVQAWNVESGEVIRHVFAPGAAGTPWRLRGVEDPTGQGLDLVWDDAGRLQTVRQRLEGRELWPIYDRQGRIVAVELRSSGEKHRLVSYEYDDGGRLAVVRDAADFPDRYEYSTKGRIVREIVKDGGVFNLRYDDKGRCVRRAGLANYDEKRLRYIDGIRSTEVTDSHGRKTVYQHNPSGQAIRVVNPDGGILTTEYDDHGRIVANTDAMGAKTRYAYDNLGNRCLVVDALGHATSLRFNDQHLATTLIDGRGHTWSREIDAMNRVIASVDPLGNRWKFVHDADGNVAEIVDPLGATKQQCFVSGVLKSASDWMGHFTNYRFDAFGQVVERTGPLGETTQLRYDAMGNPIHIRFADGSNIVAAYDHAGNLVRFVDPNGHQTRWRYGPCSRLAERFDAVGGRIQYLWGSEIGWLNQVINEAGETYDFIRDEQGRVVKEVTFDGVIRRYQYDRSERIAAFTNGCGETVQIERDSVGRVIAQMLPDGNHHRFGYDETGAMIEAVNADIAVRFERDPLGRIASEFQDDEWVVTDHDSAGNCVRIETSRGNVSEWTYDANGFPIQLTAQNIGKSINFIRDANGREIARQMPGGALLQQRFDAIGQLREQRVIRSDHSGIEPSPASMLSREIVSRSYSYDRGGNLTRIVDGHWGWSQIETDPADRLVSVFREQGTNESFRYNNIGNLTNISESNKNKFEFPISYSQGNRLTTKNNINYIYDKNGRRIKQTTLDGTTEHQEWCYEWNAIDQLTGISRPDQRSWTYIYDALGRRIKKIESTPSGDRNNTERTTYIWHESTIAHELDFLKDSTIPFDSGWLYIPNTFTPLAKLTADSFQSVICNHLGTPQELITDKADVNFLRTRKSWGNHDSGESQTAKHFQDEAYCSIVFPGQHFDIESGLCQNLYRFYDPNTHSYLSHDPLGLISGTNLYTYVCNPFRYIDPFGLCDKLYRRGPRDSKKLLESQAAAAEKSDIGIHGVSVSSSSAAKEGQVVRSASRADIEAAGFTIHKTGKDPNHFTVELPKPVTPDVARTFNDLFK